MAKQCEICGKKPVVGRTLSHAHNVSARRFEPNLDGARERQRRHPPDARVHPLHPFQQGQQGRLSAR
jgi:ribosomal protein L28